jgi:Zn-dependent metalloprotease
MRKELSLLGLCACVAAASSARAEDPHAVRVRASSASQVEAAQGPIEGLMRAGDLRPRLVQEDTLMPGRRHQRLSQSYKGVPVWGAEVVRQIDAQGRVASIFGTYHAGIALDTTPATSAEQARAAVSAAGARPMASAAPSLVVLPQEGRYSLAWALAGRSGADVRQYFVDARSGRVIHEYSLLQKQSPSVGTGTGVLNNRQKMSVTPTGADFIAQDLLRPARIGTFDMRGSLDHTIGVIVGDVGLGAADFARDADNTWTDGPVVDAHAYDGFVYDYYFKRHGRHSWNDANGQIRGLVNPVRIEDFDAYVEAGDGDVIGSFYANAFFCCGGSLLGLGGFMVYGQGVPAANPFGLPEIDPLAGGFDVVAHEMTHGMTAFTSGLYANLGAGALNESFSDQMGVAADFFFNGSSANYRIGETVWPGGIRDMADPALFGDADHVATLTDANFEVHSLASLSNHAYYLAIEGGTNRTSGITVQGVGGANRGQIEQAFYRAYQFMLTPDAFYCDAVAASILAARELHGANSRPEQAITQAWTAVGLVDLCFS